MATDLGLTPPKPTGGGQGEVTARDISEYAEGIWASVVEEPPGKNHELIDEFIRGRQGLNWTWADKYVKNGQYAWCGAFVAYVFGKFGLRQRVREKHLASTYRLWRFAKNTDRMILPEHIVGGDIVVVAPTGKEHGEKVWGNHICLCISDQESDAHGVETLEGNARGMLGDDSTGEGVINRERPFCADNPRTYTIKYGVRFLPEDYE